MNAFANFQALRVCQASERIDEDGENFLWRVVRDFFNVHAAFAGCDESHLLRSAVCDDGEVVLLADISAIFNVQAAHFLACRSGLMRDELHA